MGEHKTNSVAIEAADRPRCGSCVHFMREQGRGGHCRRMPPTVFIVPQQGPMGQVLKDAFGNPQMMPSSLFPPTYEDRWCGEHPDFMVWWSNRKRISPALEALATDAALPS